ncbi:MAG: hypothetical protein OZ922_11520 [Myxococcales bacterium]|nr:hypothetical protein [Myxococcales bacterium]
MTCRRAFETDVVAVLHGDGDPDFLAHAETCADCAAEVRVWHELDALLRAGSPAPGAIVHPAPEALAAFVDAPGSLAPDARMTIERHVAGCVVCADEVRTLRGFAAIPLSASVARGEVDAGRESGGDPTGPRGAGAAPALGGTVRHWRIGRVVWHPAFAYALVVLLAVPLVREMLPRSVPRRGTEGSPLVLREAREPESRIAAPPAVKIAPSAASPAVGLEAVLRQPKERAPVGPQAAGELPAPVGAAAAGAAADRTPMLRASGETAPSLLVLDLKAGEPTTYGAEVVGPPVTLRVGRPPDLAPGPLTVSVQAHADRRELTAHASSADTIAIDMPGGWLAPGDYLVILRPVAGGLPALLGFTVRAAADACREPARKPRERMSPSGLPTPVPTAKPWAP